MVKRTLNRQAEQTPNPATRIPHREGDATYGTAFVFAVLAIRESWLLHGKPLHIERLAGSTLRYGIHRATDAAEQTAEALAQMVSLFDIVPVRSSTGEPAPPEWFDSALQFLTACDFDTEELADLAATLKFLKEHNCGTEELLDFIHECRMMTGPRADPKEVAQLITATFESLEGRGCGVEELASSIASKSTLEDPGSAPGRLASFTDAYRRLKGCRASPQQVCWFVAQALSTGLMEAFLAAAIYDRDAAVMAAKAYLEAAAIWTRFADEIRPPEAAPALLYYYAGRRTGHRALLEAAHARLIWGEGFSDDHPRGALYQLAWKRHRELPDYDREEAATAYCAEFFRVLDRLPVEACCARGWR